MSYARICALTVSAVALIGVAGCAEPAVKKSEPLPPASATAALAVPAPSPMATGATAASIGKPAPEFTLRDTEGNDVKLSSFRGKTVVLEWFNPECPFVNAAHSKGSLKTMASQTTARGVVWLAVNSSGVGNPGNGVAKSLEGKRKFALTHPILLDETGEVGHMYAATNTPHLFVIDGAGVLVYRGAIDNSPDAEGESPTGPKLINHVQAALDDLDAKRPVGVAETKAYGCSVKYATN